jgi:hypothetical protein
MLPSGVQDPGLKQELECGTIATSCNRNWADYVYESALLDGNFYISWPVPHHEAVKIIHQALHLKVWYSRTTC